MAVRDPLVTSGSTIMAGNFSDSLTFDSLWFPGKQAGACYRAFAVYTYYSS